MLDPYAASRPADSSGAWRGRWVLYVLAVAATAALAAGAGWFVLFGDSTCAVPGPGAPWTGLRHLAIAAAVLGAPWFTAVAVSRRRWLRWLAGWAIGVSPLVYVALTHAHPTDWVGGLCF